MFPMFPPGRIQSKEDNPPGSLSRNHEARR
jgi:hypothetical protein